MGSSTFTSIPPTAAPQDTTEAPLAKLLQTTEAKETTLLQITEAEETTLLATRKAAKTTTESPTTTTVAITTAMVVAAPSATPKNVTKCSERKCINREKLKFINNEKCAFLHRTGLLREHKGDCDVFYLIDKTLYMERGGIPLTCFYYVHGQEIDIVSLKIESHGDSRCGKFDIVRDSRDKNFILEFIQIQVINRCLMFDGDNTLICHSDPISYCMGCLNEYV